MSKILIDEACREDVFNSEEHRGFELNTDEASSILVWGEALRVSKRCTYNVRLLEVCEVWRYGGWRRRKRE